MRLLALLALLACGLEAATTFRVTLSPTAKPTSGRLFVLMAKGIRHRERIATSFTPGATWFAAMEMEHIAPGETVVFDPDQKAYPQPLSKAPEGDWEFMALLDPDHTMARGGQDAGDIYSSVVGVRGWKGETVDLLLDKVTEPQPLVEVEGAELVEFQSPSLTAFWGRPILMRAVIVLPPDYDKNAKKRYPVCYRVHGFGGNHLRGFAEAKAIRKEIADGKRMQMVHVYLDASFSTGHHVFADSINNGPWGKALTTELIPHLEKKYRMVPNPSARFLTGHSSGGWSTLWLQVAYPDFFGGTWPTAPDPVDFRSFTGIDASPGSKQTAYVKADGKPNYLVRVKGVDVGLMEDFVKQEEVAGPVGGQMASFDWVFSPKGPDGRPMQLFNRVTGVQNPDVQEYWKRYDIRRIVEENWGTLGPKLRRKIKLVVGDKDTFHLDESARLLCNFLASKGAEDACEFVPGKDHSNLYSDGLALKIDREMKKKFEKR